MIKEPTFLEIEENKVFHATELSKSIGMGRKPIHFLRSALVKQLIIKNNYFIKTVKGGKNLAKQGTWIDYRLYDVYVRWINGETFMIKRNESFENDYGKILDEFFSAKVEKQYLIRISSGKKYYLDFYIPEFNLIIEYDEDHHTSKVNKIKDKKREKILKEIFNNPLIFRCTKGREFKSLKDMVILLVDNNINVDEL